MELIEKKTFSDSIKFLLELADRVKSIFFFHDEVCSSLPHPNIVALIRDMFSRKCDKLVINEFCSIVLSPADIEKLIQVCIRIRLTRKNISTIVNSIFQFLLHNNERKLFLKLMKIRMNPFQTQFGEYYLSASGNSLWIKDVAMTER